MSFLMLGQAVWSSALKSCRHFSETDSEKDFSQQECCIYALKSGHKGCFFSQESAKDVKRGSRYNSARKPAAAFSGKASVTDGMRTSINAKRNIDFTKVDPSLLKSTGNSDGQTKQGLHVSEQQLPNTDGENWRVLSRTLASRKKFSAISNRDLMRLADLRFSNDMREGDSGSQVLLLQKALFWLGFLSTESDITGYFDMETKHALCGFQEAHGVNRTAIWTALSKQALWHIISGEILHRVADERIVKSAESNTDDKSNMKSQTWQQLIPVKLADGFKTTASTDEWRFLSSIALLVSGILCGVILSKWSRRAPGNDNVMKRQIIPSAKQKTTLSSMEDMLSSSPTNGAVTGGKIMQKRHNSTSSVKIAEIVKPSDDVNGTNNVIHDPLLRQKVGSSIPSTSSTLQIKTNSGGRVANSSGMSVLNSEISKAVQKKSMQLPTNSKSDFESSALGKQSDSCARSDQCFKVSETKSLFLGRQNSMSYDRQDGSSIINSSTQGSNFRGLMPSQQAKIVRPNKHLEIDISKDEQTSIPNRELKPNIKRRIEELRKAVEIAEQNGQAAVHALEEERKRSIELEKKISRQRESAAALEEEVRVLKESHDVLLESLRKNVHPPIHQRSSVLYKRPNDDNSNDKVR